MTRAPAVTAALASVVLEVAALLWPSSAGADPLRIVPRLGVTEEFNDNLYFRDDDVGEGRVTEYITSISPGVTLQYERPTLDLSFSASNTAQIFARGERANSAFRSQSGTLSAAYEATPRLSLLATDRVSHVDRTRTEGASANTEEPPPPPDGPPPAESAVALVPVGEVVSNSFSLAADYELSPRWEATASYRNSLADFRDFGFSDLNQTVSGGLGYHWTPRFTLKGTYTYQSLGAGNAADAESHALTVGGNWLPAEQWTVDASAGVFINRSLESQSGGVSNRVGPTFNLGLTRAFEHGSVTLGGGQRITPSVGISGISQTRSAHLRGQAQLWRDLNGFVGVTYTDFDTDTDDFRAVQTSAGLDYPLAEYVRASLTYSYRWRESDQTVITDDQVLIEEGTVDGNVVRLTITAYVQLWQLDL